MFPRFGRHAALAAAILFSQMPAAKAQNFDRPVRIIVPFAPGGTSDILARLISPKLSAAIGQSVVIENKPGASGNLGADAVAKATPDGTTLLLTDLGSLTTAPSLFSNLTYNLEKDLAPVTMVMFGPYVLAVHESIPVKTPAELIAYAKANPGKLAVANSGVGAEIAGRTGLVFDHHRLADRRRQLWADQPRQNIGGAAGRERHDDAHRAVEILCRSRAGQLGEQDGCRKDGAMRQT